MSRILETDLAAVTLGFRSHNLAGFAIQVAFYSCHQSPLGEPLPARAVLSCQDFRLKKIYHSYHVKHIVIVYPDI